MILSLLLAGCAPASCSHTAEITKAATTVNQLATESKVKAQEIAASAASDAPDLPAIVEKASQIASAMSSIQSECQTIAISAGNVDDKQSQWVTLIEYVSIAVGLIALCVLSWYWGIGNLLRPLFAKIGTAFASDQKKSEAKLAKDLLEGKATPSELVAVMRQDPMKNELFKKGK